MKLSNKSIMPLVRGAYQMKEEEGYLTFYHYDDSQVEYLKFNEWFYNIARVSSSVKLEFETDATEIGFDYKIFWVGTPDTIDILSDNTPVVIKHIDNIPPKGSLTFNLPEGKKKLTVYFPTDVRLGIKNLRIEGKWRNIKKKAPKVLWIGDSITQGSDFHKCFKSKKIINLGHGGDSIDGITKRVNMAKAVSAQKLFLLGGI
ncbi:MAG: hypothetical protein IIU77_07835, partial [Clostridia bacterium]|nr:hypothetical protein [Clostridia bacterium]